jgi:hypothetical protein
MYGMDYLLLLDESRERMQRAERRATLMASLGPLPKPAPFRLFRRRAVPLSTPVEIRRHSSSESSVERGERAA